MHVEKEKGGRAESSTGNIQECNKEPHLYYDGMQRDRVLAKVTMVRQCPILYVVCSIASTKTQKKNMGQEKKKMTVPTPHNNILTKRKKLITATIKLRFSLPSQPSILGFA